MSANCFIFFGTSPARPRTRQNPDRGTEGNVCKLLQLLGVKSPTPSTGVLPVDPTGDFCPPNLLGYSPPNEKSCRRLYCWFTFIFVCLHVFNIALGSFLCLCVFSLGFWVLMQLFARKDSSPKRHIRLMCRIGRWTLLTLSDQRWSLLSSGNVNVIDCVTDWLQISWM